MESCDDDMGDESDNDIDDVNDNVRNYNSNLDKVEDEENRI